MKKYFGVALAFVLMMGSAVMASAQKANPVSEYMEQLNPIADILIKATNLYSALEIDDPENACKVLQTQVIPMHEDYVTKLFALTDKIKDEKVKDAHAIMMGAAELQLQGYQMMLQAFQEIDPEDTASFYEVFQGAQVIMVESMAKADEFVNVITALTKEFDPEDPEPFLKTQ